MVADLGLDEVEGLFVISCKEFIVNVNGNDDDGWSSFEKEDGMVSMRPSKANAD